MGGETAQVVAGLRHVRTQHERVVFWLNVLAPPLLALFVLAVWTATPAPAASGPGLAVAAGAAGFVVGVLGRNATAQRRRWPHLGFVAVLAASAALLAVVQPDGPGLVGLLLAMLCVARLLPARVATPLLLLAFVVTAALAAVAERADLAWVTAFSGFYGLLYLAFRLNEATRRAERLVAELESTREAQARAAGLAERQRLAREMHDVLAHALSGLVLQVEGARMLAAADPTDPRLPAALDRAHQLGRSGLAEARRAIGTLRDDDLPGVDRIPELVARLERDQGVPCRVTVTGAPRPLGAEAGLALYRVAQEALTNVTRHAAAEQVALTLEYRPSTTVLTVEDVGAPPTAAPGPGYGLTGMRERAELLGGTLTTGATPTGFRVELEVPA